MTLRSSGSKVAALDISNIKSKRLFAFISWEVGNETDTGGCDRRNDNLEITVLGEFGLTSIDGV